MTVASDCCDTVDRTLCQQISVYLFIRVFSINFDLWRDECVHPSFILIDLGRRCIPDSHGIYCHPVEICEAAMIHSRKTRWNFSIDFSIILDDRQKFSISHDPFCINSRVFEHELDIPVFERKIRHFAIVPMLCELKTIYYFIQKLKQIEFVSK